jgi:uracil-DNA glycosylase
VPPGSGWPGDQATPATPVAQNRADVRELAASAGSLAEVAARESVCRACDRLVRWREEVALARRRSFRHEVYWGRPVPTWGADRAAILILGLAPAAHGGNRTGRIFTGDRSGDVLFASLWRCGLASQPTSVAADDGQRLISARMSAVVRCAPPANKPEPSEREACSPWLAAELSLLRQSLRVVVCLGHFAWQAIWPQLAAAGYEVPRPRPAFGHGAEVRLPPVAGRAAGRTAGRTAPRTAGQAPGQAPGQLPGQTQGQADGWAARPLTVIGCYHPSQQNTFTGRVTDAMLDTVFGRAREASR